MEILRRTLGFAGEIRMGARWTPQETRTPPAPVAGAGGGKTACQGRRRPHRPCLSAAVNYFVAIWLVACSSMWPPIHWARTSLGTSASVAVSFFSDPLREMV